MFFINICTFQSLALFSNCAARFVSDMVGNPEDRFSRNPAHMSFRENVTLYLVWLFVHIHSGMRFQNIEKYGNLFSLAS